MTAVLRANTRLLVADRDAPDAATTLADCRIAVAAAQGVDLDQVDPALGWRTDDAAYRRVRAGWADPAVYADTPYVRDGYARARAWWEQARPDLAVDWPAWGGDPS